MRILALHCDYISYQPKQKAIKGAEPLSEQEKKPVTVKDVLVVFSSVEKPDERSPDRVAERAAEEIADVASKVKAKRLVLYPYAHLSPNLSSPSTAIFVLKRLESLLRERGYDVTRTKFGWYKSFELKCKGHPLAELSRSITVEEEKPAPPPKEEKELMIVDLDGQEHPLRLEEIDRCEVLKEEPLLKQFILSEEVGKVPHEPPAHIRLMQKLELVDYEPASDVGHFRFYPKGALVKRLLESLASKLAVEDLGCMRIETPILYRMDEADIAEQTSRFIERDYRFEADGKEFTLRFAGDFGLFKMMRDTTVSYKQLPIRIYELSHSYRLEKRGECVGLRRLRAFTMPDVHCFCESLEQAMHEFESLLRCYTKLADSIGVDYVFALRIVKDFYLENKGWVRKLIRVAKKPALVELLAERKHYWIVKHEYQFVDSIGASAQLCTVQLDVEDSKRYGLFYTGPDGEKKAYIIVHSSMGSIERWLYAVLEEAAKAKLRGEPPMLPVWLSPTQVRILPVSSDQMGYAKELLDELKSKGIRADLDDRDLSLAKKVRDAEVEWIPYVVTIGEKERRGGFITVRVRGDGIREWSFSELVSNVNEAVRGMPRLPPEMPPLLSSRPKFV